MQVQHQCLVHSRHLLNASPIPQGTAQTTRCHNNKTLVRADCAPGMTEALSKGACDRVCQLSSAIHILRNDRTGARLRRHQSTQDLALTFKELSKAKNPNCAGSSSSITANPSAQRRPVRGQVVLWPPSLLPEGPGAEAGTAPA